jgi:hypothetical protein
LNLQIIAARDNTKNYHLVSGQSAFSPHARIACKAVELTQRRMNVTPHNTVLDASPG